MKHFTAFLIICSLAVALNNPQPVYPTLITVTVDSVKVEDKGCKYFISFILHDSMRTAECLYHNVYWSVNTTALHPCGTFTVGQSFKIYAVD